MLLALWNILYSTHNINHFWEIRGNKMLRYPQIIAAKKGFDMSKKKLLEAQ
jgi:hypothetical protein